MSLSTPELMSGARATEGLFGGNILASRGTLLDNSYDAAVDDLGVTTLRFPGGSLTEYLFDIRRPDAPKAYDARYSTEQEMISLSHFMRFAGDNGHPVTIVIPTQTQLGLRTDSNGDRLPEIEEAALRGFVQDVANGAYGNAEVRAFEVGNEYWGSGLMNAAEYGRLAAEMSVIIDDALSEIDADGIDIVVQKGNNYAHSRLSEDYIGVSGSEAIADINARHDLNLGDEAVYQSGRVNWTHVNNQIILSNFDTDAEREAIDGVAAHIYSRGADNPTSRSFDLHDINGTWRDEMPDLDVYVTEWNLKSTASLDREEDYGLFQAHEMLNMVEEFMRLDVTEANVWPLIQNTSNALSNGIDYDEATVGGEMFGLMSETLPGKTLLDFSPQDAVVSEQVMGDVAIHGFAGERELALYVVNTDRDDPTMTDVDISGLVASFDDADITRLGVAGGEPSGSNGSRARVDELASGDVIEDGFVVADLLPGEILQIVLSGVTPTDAFRPAWQQANDKSHEALTRDARYLQGETEETDVADTAGSIAADAEEILLPTIPLHDEFEREDGEDPLVSFDDDMDSLGLGLAFLPLLALLGMAAF